MTRRVNSITVRTTRMRNDASQRRRRRQGNAPPYQIPRMVAGGKMPLGFPDKLMTRLRYHQNGILTSTVGSTAIQAFRWNSTFDPDLTGTGHQPLYRDTLAALYDQYAVVSAHATIKFVNTLTADVICGVVTDDDASTSTSLDTLCEQTHGQHAYLPPITGSLSTKTFRTDWDCKRVLSIDPYSSELYKTLVGSNPTEGSNLVLWMGQPAATTTSVSWDIEIYYDVLWTELATPTQS